MPLLQVTTAIPDQTSCSASRSMALVSPLLTLTDLGREGWQATFRVPPGLAVGSHEVRMRTLASPFGNSFDIVRRDAPEPPSRVRVQPVPLDQAAEPPPEIYEVEGSITETAVLRGYRNERLCCYFRSVADNLSGDEIILEVDELEQPVLFLTKGLGKLCGAEKILMNTCASCARTGSEQNFLRLTFIYLLARRQRKTRSESGAPGRAYFEAPG